MKMLKSWYVFSLLTFVKAHFCAFAQEVIPRPPMAKVEQIRGVNYKGIKISAFRPSFGSNSSFLTARVLENGPNSGEIYSFATTISGDGIRNYGVTLNNQPLVEMYTASGGYFMDSPEAVALAPRNDGAVYFHYVGNVSRKASLAKFGIDGKLDPEFNDGKIIELKGPELSNNVSRATFSNTQIKFDSRGNVYLVGVFHQFIGLGKDHFSLMTMKFHPDGKWDKEFGNKGFAQLSFGEQCAFRGNQELVITKADVRPDGIYVLGVTDTNCDGHNSPNPKDLGAQKMFISKWDLQGKPVADFGTEGLVLKRFGADATWGSTFEVIKDKLIIIGNVQTQKKNGLFVAQANLRGQFLPFEGEQMYIPIKHEFSSSVNVVKSCSIGEDKLRLGFSSHGMINSIAIDLRGNVLKRDVIDLGGVSFKEKFYTGQNYVKDIALTKDGKTLIVGNVSPGLLHEGQNEHNQTRGFVIIISN